MTNPPAFGSTFGLLTLLALFGTACSPDSTPRTVDTQTNWLTSCNADADCGGLVCLCGACTRGCTDNDACAGLAGAECVLPDDPGSLALCGGTKAEAGLCLLRCESTECAEDQACVAGVCEPANPPNTVVTVAPETRFQVLTGFGATLAYAEASVVAHPEAEALARTMFADLGLDVLRLRNHYGYPGEEDLSSAAEILDTATGSLGRKPLLILASWSPPADQKANLSLTCAGDEATCTLASSADSFDYAAYGDYWRDSLAAYESAGLSFDHIGIQNNPEFVPLATIPGEGCRFLPAEGETSIFVNGVATQVRYPGYREALAAVKEALGTEASSVGFLAPDTADPRAAEGFMTALDPTELDGLAHHLYGVDASAPDLELLGSLSALGQDHGLPVFQTEIPCTDGLSTAIMIHHALTTAQSSMYLVSALVGPSGLGLIAVDGSTFSTEPSYHALRHYALFTDPSWTRVAVESTSTDLLASAWLAPDQSALSVVLINTSGEEMVTRSDLGGFSAESAEVTRTVFAGDEQFARLGALPENGVVRLPAGSVVTLALTAQTTAAP